MTQHYVDTVIENKNNEMSFIYMELASSAAALENLNRFLTSSPGEYFEYTEKYWETTKVDNRVSTTLTRFFGAFSDLDELYLALEDSPTYVRATRSEQYGVRLEGQMTQPEGLTLRRNIVNPYNFNQMGTLYGVFGKQAVLGNLSNSLEKWGISTLIYNNYGELMFIDRQNLKESQEIALLEGIKTGDEFPNQLGKEYTVVKKNLQNGLVLVLLANKGTWYQKNALEFFVIISIGLLLISVLVIVLRRTFIRYLQQISELVQFTHEVAEGNLSSQIDTSHFQEELYELATAVNFMIRSLDEFIRENYELEIKQRDAHMRALQSQINPHFLYNTLEYIRMYALSRQQEELAEVVYAFSALLRNNTTQEKTTTIEKELSFCEKYVYLYQMRYPNEIAYHFQLEKEWEDFVIPKFTIQPLIENYFVHGIDYTRNDNALSITVKTEGTDLLIQIIDNGKGISATRLEEIRSNLDSSQEVLTTSIGLKNVHERMQRSFGDAYQMEIYPTLRGQGTTIAMRIKNQVGEENV